MEIIGSKGWKEAEIILPQGTSLPFTVTHKDEDGHVVDHSRSTAKMAFVFKNSTHHLDSCCTCTESGVAVLIPASTSASLPLGKFSWDIMVTTDQGEVIRMAFGKGVVDDTYAHDEE